MQRWLSVLTIGAMICAGCQGAESAGPLKVDPAAAEETREGGARADSELETQQAQVLEPQSERGGEEEVEPETPSPSVRPGAGEGATGGVWVVDNQGEPLGVLVRRGSDDNLVYRAIYDLVTVFHPDSGLFFEVTMSDALVRRPSTTFFASASCDDPIGISYGGCAECRSGPGTAILHDGAWYRVVPGVTYEVTTAGSTLGSGMQDQCSSHHTDSAKIFPLEELLTKTPPSAFEAPLHFEWR